MCLGPCCQAHVIRMTLFGFLLTRTLLLQERRGHVDTKPRQCDKGQVQSTTFMRTALGWRVQEPGSASHRRGRWGFHTARAQAALPVRRVHGAVGVSRKEVLCGTDWQGVCLWLSRTLESQAEKLGFHPADEEPADYSLSPPTPFFFDNL